MMPWLEDRRDADTGHATARPGLRESTMDCTASVELPDGTTETYTRHGDSAHFVVFGRDALGVRRQEKPAVVQWCASADGAFNVLPE